jgi:hypothetical protein
MVGIIIGIRVGMLLGILLAIGILGIAGIIGVIGDKKFLLHSISLILIIWNGSIGGYYE